MVVEEKRKLIEIQIKEALFDDPRYRVYGWYKGGAGREHGEELFPTRAARWTRSILPINWAKS